MCKNTQSKNSQPIEPELTVLSSNQGTAMDRDKVLQMHHEQQLQNQEELYDLINQQWGQFNDYQHQRQKLKLQIDMNANKLAIHNELWNVVMLAQDNTQNVDLNGHANAHDDSDFS